MSPEDVDGLRGCISAGGVVLFPSDTVYGLATAPESEHGVRRLYALKGRPADRPAAVMFFDLDLALATLAEVGPRARAALRRLLPGPLTVVLANPARHFHLACGPRPDRLGLRVPALTGALAPLAGVDCPLLQSSANRSGGSEARRLEQVDARVRAGADLQLDGGELPGTASTVVDLSSYEPSGEFEILREGALPAGEIAAAL